MELKFHITGMTCAACAARVESVTRAVSGVADAEVNLLAGKMLVKCSTDCAPEIILAVENAGYHASLPGSEKRDTAVADKNKGMLLRIISSAVFLLALMYLTMGHMLGIHGWQYMTENAMLMGLSQLLLTLPVVYLNRSYFARGLKALFHRAPNMDSLIAIGSGASLVYGIAALFIMAYAMGRGDWARVVACRDNLYFESAAMILTLITVGKYLESIAKGKTGDAIRKLMDLSPKIAERLDGETTQVVPVEDIALGDIDLTLTLKDVYKEDGDRVTLPQDITKNCVAVNGRIKVVCSGDVNGDGSVNSLDVICLSRYLGGWVGYDNVEPASADVDANNEVTSLDLVYLVRHIADWSGYEALGVSE